MRRRRRVRAGVFALLATSCLVASACGPRFATFSDHGVTFHYPRTWRVLPRPAAEARTGTVLHRDAVGIDESNLALLVVYELNVPINDENFGQYRDQLIGEITRSLTSAGGRLRRPPESIRMGGMPSLLFVVAGVTRTGTSVEATAVAAFRGKAEYFLNCQHTAAHADEIERGCQQIVDTFEVETQRD